MPASGIKLASRCTYAKRGPGPRLETWPNLAQVSLFDFFARDCCAVLACIGIGSGQHLGHFFFGLFGFFIAFVFFFGHVVFPKSGFRFGPCQADRCAGCPSTG